MRSALLAAGLVALAAAASAQEGPPRWTQPLRPAGSRPSALSDVGFDQRLGQPLPLSLPLRDETGKTVKLGDYFGRRPVVLALVYYECPMLCTLTLNGLASALDVLTFDPGKDFEIVTVSFDPSETPELAAAKKQVYLRRYRHPGAPAAWHFLTGDAESIAALTGSVGFRYAWDAETKQFAHPAGLVVATADGRIARYLYGVEYAPRDLRFALLESSAGRIGTPIDRAVLYCFRYDPMTGRYSMVILNVLKIAAGLTVTIVASFLVVMLRRERTSSAPPVKPVRERRAS